MDADERYYKTTRLVRKKTSDVETERGHQVYTADRLTGRIIGEFTARQSLHVSTGLLVSPQEAGIESDAPLVKGFHRTGEVFTVPGSSLKGPVRSFVETITFSCVSKTREYWKGSEREEYGECRYNSHRREGKICPACKMFGAMGYEGQIFFSDAPMVEGKTAVHFISAQHQPKGDDARRHYPHALQDRRDPTWPLAVTLPGSRFNFRPRFENLTTAEMGLLLLALGQGDPAICLKIGAGKSSGLGAIQFNRMAVEQVIVADLYAAYDSSAAWMSVDTAVCLTAAQKLLRPDDALSRLQADLGCGRLR